MYFSSSCRAWSFTCTEPCFSCHILSSCMQCACKGTIGCRQERHSEVQCRWTLPGMKHTFFSMLHIAKLQPCRRARLHSSASIHSLLPELGTPVTMDSSPGTTWGQANPLPHQMTSCQMHASAFL